MLHLYVFIYFVCMQSHIPFVCIHIFHIIYMHIYTILYINFTADLADGHGNKHVVAISLGWEHTCAATLQVRCRSTVSSKVVKW